MDGDGKIDFYEFTCCITLFTQTDDDERIDSIFNIFDTDSTQSCSKEEFGTLIETILRTNPSITVTKSMIDAMVNNFETTFFIKDGIFSKDIFKIVAVQTDEIRKSLYGLGLIKQSDMRINIYENDLTEEDLKYNIADERDEKYENRKKGIEDTLPNDIGIL